MDTADIIYRHLPPLSKMVGPALATFARGVKIGDKGIYMKRHFNNVMIDMPGLTHYRQFFGFEQSLPLPYLYLLGQRAQAATMLEKEYSLSIPGTIHLSNEMVAFCEVIPSQPISMEVSISVPFKVQGSLLPEIEVNFFQKESNIARSISKYLVKRRKRKGLKGRKTIGADDVSTSGDQVAEWDLDRKVARSYARLSDDYNPIHTSKWAARIMGFKRPIAHGWFSASKMLAALPHSERFQVQFLKPVSLPGKYCVIKSNENCFYLVGQRGEACVRLMVGF